MAEEFKDDQANAEWRAPEANSEKSLLLPNELTTEQEEKAVALSKDIYDSVAEIMSRLDKSDTLTNIIFRIAENDIVFTVKEGEGCILLTCEGGSRENPILTRFIIEKIQSASKEDQELALSLAGPGGTHLRVGHSRELLKADGIEFDGTIDRIAYTRREGRMLRKPGDPVPSEPEDYEKYTQNIEHENKTGFYDRRKDKIINKLNDILTAIKDSRGKIVIERPLKTQE